MFIGNNAIKWHFVFCHCFSVSLNKFCIQPSFLMILCTLKAKKYFQTININDSVSWVKYAVWSDRSTYCYLEIYELWAFISGRQFLATMKEGRTSAKAWASSLQSCKIPTRQGGIVSWRTWSLFFARLFWRLMEKTILNFHFDYLQPSLIITLFSEKFTTFSTGFNHCNFSFPSRSRSFPGMEAFDSLLEFREWIFFIPFPFPNFGNGFFHSLPVPEFRE